MINQKFTSSTTKVQMMPIIQALEFQISAVLVNPRKGSVSWGSTLGFSTWKHSLHQNSFTRKKRSLNLLHTPAGSFAALTLNLLGFLRWRKLGFLLSSLQSECWWVMKDDEKLEMAAISFLSLLLFLHSLVHISVCVNHWLAILHLSLIQSWSNQLI